MNILTLKEDKGRISDICNSIPIGWTDFFMENKSKIKVIDKKLENSDYIPESNLVFSAFRFITFDDIKIVIVGQDPYPNEENCSGMAFSAKGKTIPASLKNIFNNLVDNKLIKEYPKHGNLEKWALQGVFLINTSLTCERDVSDSHKDIWKDFTDELFKKLMKKDNLIYLAFGNHAQARVRGVDRKRNIVLETSHPSPMGLRYGFDKSNCFGKANEELEKRGEEKVDWSL